MAITDFHFFSAKSPLEGGGNTTVNPSTTPIGGGMVVFLKATSAIAANFAVAADSAHTGQAVASSSTTALASLGFAHGYVDGQGEHIDVSAPANSQTIIQVAGISLAVADATITVGSAVTASSGTAGRVMNITPGSGNVGNSLGTALTAGTAGATFYVLIGKY